MGSARLHSLLFPVVDRWRNLVHPPTKLLQLKMACSVDSEIYYYFLRYGCMVPHAFGITFSCDSIGADVYIGQNATTSTSGRNMDPGDNTKGKPRIGNLVRIYAGAVISGEISIGEMCVIAANSIVTKDVPPRSIVYGVNDARPLREHHYDLLHHQLFHCKNVYQLIPGLTLENGELYIDEEWSERRNLPFAELRKPPPADVAPY